MPRFLQLHTLTSYPAALLNRDDVGFAKRLPFGSSERVRISSQCLKRHWRRADDENALDRIPSGDGKVPMALRSRRTFEKYLHEPLVAEGVADDVAAAVTEEILAEVLPKGKKRQADQAEEEAEGKAHLRTEQVTVIGEPEMSYFRELARELVRDAGSAKEVRAAVKKSFKGQAKKNLETMRVGAGLDAALFGRMVTGDILARCDAAVHVAHAFTVHDGGFETDYFSAVDDLQPREETGSGHINTSELTSGLFYGYVVVDVPLLVSNLEGCARDDWQTVDRSLAAEVIRRLAHLIATVSPGAKLGSTAPYSHALLVLAESGNRQPRTLANAFLEPVGGGNLLGETCRRLDGHLSSLDKMYERAESRVLAGIELTPELFGEIERVTLPNLARWAATQVGDG